MGFISWFLSIITLSIYKYIKILHFKSSEIYQRGIFKSHNLINIEPVLLKIYSILYIQVEAKEVLIPVMLET